MIAVSTLELTIRMIAALGVILAMLAGCNVALRRFNGGRSRLQAPIRVRAQQRLDKHASVHLVEAGDRRVLVGTTTGSIVVLAEGDDLVVDDQSVSEGPQARQHGRRGETSNRKLLDGELLDGELLDRHSLGRESLGRDLLDRDRGDKQAHPIDLRITNPLRSLQNKTVRRG